MKTKRESTPRLTNPYHFSVMVLFGIVITSFFSQSVEAQQQRQEIESSPRNLQHEILNKWFREFEEIIKPFDKDVLIDFVRSKIANVKDYPWLEEILYDYLLSRDNQEENIVEQEPLDKDHNLVLSSKDNMFDDKSKDHFEVAKNVDDDVVLISEHNNPTIGLTKDLENKSPPPSIMREDSFLSERWPIPSFMMRFIFPFARRIDEVVGDVLEEGQEQPSTFESIQQNPHLEVETTRKQDKQEFKDKIVEHFVSREEHVGDSVVVQKSFGVLVLPTNSHSERFTENEHGLDLTSDSILSRIASQDPVLTRKEMISSQTENENDGHLHDYSTDAVHVKKPKSLEMEDGRSSHENGEEDPHKKENPSGVLMTSSDDEVGQSPVLSILSMTQFPSVTLDERPAGSLARFL